MQAHGQRDWALPEGFRIQFEGEAAELFVGGVYVRLFLKNPQFPLRHPKARPSLLIQQHSAPVTPLHAHADWQDFSIAPQMLRCCTSWMLLQQNCA